MKSVNIRLLQTNVNEETWHNSRSTVFVHGNKGEEWARTSRSDIKSPNGHRSRGIDDHQRHKIEVI